MSRLLVLLLVVAVLAVALGTAPCADGQPVMYGGESRALNAKERAIVSLVLRHAEAWAKPSRCALANVLAPDVLFAYPTTKLDYAGTLLDFDTFVEYFTNTTIVIPRDGILVDAKIGRVSVQWKFSTFARATGVRQVVNDVCVGHVRKGRFSEWFEFLDGRVKTLQTAGVLSYADGSDGLQKPWPAFVSGKEHCRAVVSVTCP